MLPFIAVSISASVGFGVFASSAEADISWPAWQYPHCGTSSSTHARCSGCAPSAESPSIVVTSAPASVETRRWHERIGAPLMCTVHEPHWPMPQPNFVPLRSRWSRSTQRSGVSSATSTVLDLPLTLNVTVMASSGFSFVALECLRADLGAVDDSLRVYRDSFCGAGVG